MESASAPFGGGFTDLGDFVLKAVQLGALGFGAVIFVMVFLILLRNQAPPDPSTARLRTAFLYTGTAAFLAACAVQLITLFAQPKPAGAYKVSVAFAPELDVAKLPQPSMRILPANQEVKLNEPFTVDQNATLSVGIGGIIEQAETLKAAAKALSDTNEALSKTVAQDTTQVPGPPPPGGPAPKPATPPTPADTPAIRPSEAARLSQLSTALNASVATGDLAAVRRNTMELNRLRASAAVRP